MSTTRGLFKRQGTGIIVEGVKLPDNCKHCLFYDCEFDEDLPGAVCNAKNMYIDPTVFGKPEWCPVREYKPRKGRMWDRG